MKPMTDCTTKKYEIEHCRASFVLCAGVMFLWASVSIGLAEDSIPKQADVLELIKNPPKIDLTTDLRTQFKELCDKEYGSDLLFSLHLDRLLRHHFRVPAFALSKNPNVHQIGDKFSVLTSKNKTDELLSIVVFS